MLILCDESNINMMCEQRFRHYLVGNTEHDNQHWALLKQMDALVSAIKQKEPFDDLRIDMLSMLEVHFHAEDAYMSSIGYPYIAAHAEDHSRMVRRLDSMVNDATSGGLGSIVAMHQLEDMFIQHITHHDQQYVEWYKNKASSLSVEPSLPGQAS